MHRKNLGAKGSTTQFIIAALCLTVLASGAIAEPNSIPEEWMQGGEILLLTEGGDYPFDPNAQDFSVVVYDSGSNSDAIQDAMESLGIFRYTVRWAENPVTAADLAANDILVVEHYAPYGTMAGLDPAILLPNITGRVVITGHDPDWHMRYGVFGGASGAKFLENAIRWVLKDPETGLIVLASKTYAPEKPFPYLPPEWDISATNPEPLGIYEYVNDEYIAGYTDAGKASGLYAGLDCNDMSSWHDSFHNIFFTGLGTVFMKMELGGTSHEDVITLARGNVYNISLTIANDVDPNTCVEPGAEIVYTLTYEYPSDPNHTADANNIVIVDTLPHGTDYELYSSTGDYDPGTHTLTWDIETLEPGDSGSVSFTVTVNDNAEPGGKLRDDAKLTSNAGTVMARNDIEVCCSDDIIFVCAAAPDGGAGRNWATAYNNLQDALARARRGCGNVIWVAQGTYKPGPGVADSFKIPPGASVYGGFSSGEDPATFDLADRNFRMCRTVLSGQIDADTRNYIVVTMASDSLLDGVVVERAQYRGVYGQDADFGVANCAISETLEDGIRCENGNLTCTNCTIRDNAGNGIYASGQGKSLSVRNANIHNNGMNGIFAWYPVVDVRNSVIYRNGSRGAYYYGIRLIEVQYPSLIRNCTIACNANEGVADTSSANAWVRNCILWYNQTHFPANCSQVAGFVNVTYSCITDPNNPGCTSSAQVGPRYNMHCPPGFADPNVYLIPNFHLAGDSNCIDKGEPSPAIPYTGETDMDANDRVVDGAVDIGADEVACTLNIYNRADLDADGIVNFYDFAILGNAWQGHDPNDPSIDPNVIDPNCLARWSEVCNLSPDYAIDMKDLLVFADNWLWQACWYRQAPDPLPPCDYTTASYGAAFDPNDLIDPNDLLGLLNMAMPSVGDQMSLSVESAASATYEPELTAQQLKETISFLHEIAAESPEEADNIAEFIRSLLEELDAISESGTFEWYSQ